MTVHDEIPISGVRGLEHTADVGLEVEAPTLPELFRRSALGSMWLVLEEISGPPELQTRALELVEEDLPALLRSWLRALLRWHESDAFVTVDAEVVLTPVPLCASADGQAFGLKARVKGWTHGGTPVREIKGVTLHGLDVAQNEEGWRGRVIFDV